MMSFNEDKLEDCFIEKCLIFFHSQIFTNKFAQFDIKSTPICLQHKEAKKLSIEQTTKNSQNDNF
jgi:hypothetical protein